MFLKNENGYVELWGLFLVLITIIMIAIWGFVFINPLFTQEQYQDIQVVEKIPYHNGQYLIVADICTHHSLALQKEGAANTCDQTRSEVFTVSDELILLKFDASDRYAALKEGKGYSVDICGIRYQPLSLYRNIYEIRER